MVCRRRGVRSSNDVTRLNHYSLPMRSARSLLLISFLCVIAAFAAARTSQSASTSHLFDYLHWTIAYLVATVLAWRGVTQAQGADRVPRIWFARGLTVTLFGQLLFDLQELEGRVLFPDLSDFLFLGLGPCCVWGLVAWFRSHAGLARK